MAFMYKILNGGIAVPMESLDLIENSRPVRGEDSNKKRLIILKPNTEEFRQSASTEASFKCKLTKHLRP